MRVTAVVVNHDTSAYLPTCLDALLAQDHPDLRIVVVDNASRDGAAAILEGYRDVIEPIYNHVNRGYAGALNDVLATDEADAVLVCNPDVVAHTSYVRLLVAALEADPARGSVQGTLLRPGGPVDSTGHVAFRSRLFRNRDEGRPVDAASSQPGPVFGVTGACALHRRAMLDDVAVPVPGGRAEVFDEDLFAYFEDVDLDWRAAMRGWVAWHEPAAVAVHVRRGMQRGRSSFVEELNWRNRLLVLLKCDTLASLREALPAFFATTLIKTSALGFRQPVALARAVAGVVRRAPRMLAKRREVQRRASVPSRVVADRWFEPFSYRDWWVSYRRRVLRR